MKIRYLGKYSIRIQDSVLVPVQPNLNVKFCTWFWFNWIQISKFCIQFRLRKLQIVYTLVEHMFYKLEIDSYHPVLYLKVLVVGGGYYGRYNEISSTEIFTMGSKSWSVSAPLSLPVSHGFASVSLNNKVYFLGKLFFIFAKLSLNSTQLNLNSN